jgi:predicted  nucleic acid-binding Zn-ribbon protein
MATYKMDTMGNFILQSNDSPSSTFDLGDGIDIPATPNEAGRFSQYFTTKEDFNALNDFVRSEIDIQHLENRVEGLESSARDLRAFDLDDFGTRLDDIENTIQNVDLDDISDKIDNLDADRLDNFEGKIEDLGDRVESLAEDMDAIQRVIRGVLTVLRQVTDVIESDKKASEITEETARASQL